MFTRLLRVVLYLVLLGCIVWGTVLIGGPSALHFILKRTLGDNVTLYNLRITPRLSVLVSRIEVNGIRYQDKFLVGSIKSFETKMTGLLKFEPVLDISVGQIQLENFASIGETRASFYLPEISIDGKVNVDLELTEILTQNSVSAEYLAASGQIDLRNGVLLDASIAARNISSLRGVDLNFSAMNGSLSNWQFLNNKVSNLGFLDFELQELKFFNNTIAIENATVSSELSGNKYNITVVSDDLTYENDNYTAQGVSAYLSTLSSDPGKIEKITFNANSIMVPPSRFLECGEVTDLSIDLTSTNNSSYEFFANGKLAETKLMVEKFPVADLSNSNFKLTSKYAFKGDASSDVEAVFKLYSENEKSIGVDAVASLDVSGKQIFDCIRDKCVFSNFLLDYHITAYQDKLGGVFSCLKFPCENSRVEHEIVTNNTSSFFESATTSKVFNPIFLTFLYRTLLAGEQVGDGHSFRF